MGMSGDTVKSLASLGANVEVDASAYSSDTAKEIVALANGAGGHVTVVHASRYSGDTLKQIAALGRKNVTFLGLGEQIDRTRSRAVAHPSLPGPRRWDSLADAMTVRLYAHRYWRDEDSILFLDDPKAMGLPPEKFRGQEVVIANGCTDGTLLADVVDDLKRYGATKIILTSLKKRPRVLRSLNRRPQVIFCGVTHNFSVLEPGWHGMLRSGSSWDDEHGVLELHERRLRTGDLIAWWAAEDGAFLRAAIVGST